MDEGKKKKNRIRMARLSILYVLTMVWVMVRGKETIEMSRTVLLNRCASPYLPPLSMQYNLLKSYSYCA